VTEHADYGGDHFDDEARKICQEEAEPHGIYDEATAEEASAPKGPARMPRHRFCGHCSISVCRTTDATV
jgi:hypothetical protein